MSKTRRYTQASVNNFIHCGDEYLFLLRDKNKKIDAGRLNSIGGKVDSGENFLDAVIRETAEEVGILLAPQDIELTGVVKLEGGYDDDWVMCFFKTEVSSKDLPVGTKTRDGELIWIHKDDVLKSKYELVDDLYYLFDNIINSQDHIFFSTVQLSESQKIHTHSISRLHRKKKM